MKNGVTLKSPAELIGDFYAVVFAPIHLSLVKEGPLFRRRFLDTALCQLKPSYAKTLAKYNHTLTQRNALLKDIQFHPELLDTLEVWDDRLSSYGAAVVSERVKYTAQLSENCAEIYAGLSGNREMFEDYQSRHRGLARDCVGRCDERVGRTAAVLYFEPFGRQTGIYHLL